MKIFVWERVENCTDNCHSEGGVVVVADTIEDAILMAKNDGCSIEDDEHPDLVLDVHPESEKKVFLMPDAGCC